VSDMESNIAVYRAEDGEYGVVRVRYSPVPYGVKDRKFKTYQAINSFDGEAMKEDWSTYYTDLENWTPLRTDNPITIFVKLFNILYDGDLYVNARCTNSRCDGYETEFDEWYFEDERDVFRKIIEVFNY